MYLDQLSVIGSSGEHSNIHDLEHTCIVATGLVLFKAVVIRSILIILNGEGILPIFFVDLSNAFLGLGNIADTIGVDVELYGCFEEFDALSRVDLFFDVCCFLVEICSLASLA